VVGVDLENLFDTGEVVIGVAWGQREDESCIMAEFLGWEGSGADDEVGVLDAVPLVVGEDSDGNVFAWVGLRPFWVSDEEGRAAFYGVLV
jgi:hypothetical protein